jgi:hypothetical protein
VFRERRDLDNMLMEQPILRRQGLVHLHITSSLAEFLPSSPFPSPGFGTRGGAGRSLSSWEMSRMPTQGAAGGYPSVMWERHTSWVTVRGQIEDDPSLREPTSVDPGLT